MLPDLLWVCESAAATVTSASATFSNGRIDGRTDATDSLTVKGRTRLWSKGHVVAEFVHEGEREEENGE